LSWIALLSLSWRPISGGGEVLVSQAAPSTVGRNKRFAAMDKVLHNPPAFGIPYQGTRRDFNDQVLAGFA
jgi:hypothetical protein